MLKFKHLSSEDKRLLIPGEKTKEPARVRDATRGAPPPDNPYNMPNWRALSEEQREFYRGLYQAVQKVKARLRRTGKMFDWDEGG